MQDTRSTSLSPPSTAMRGVSDQPPRSRYSTTVQRGATPVTLTYDDAGNLTVDNANGSRVTYAYDPENRLISMRHYTGSRYTFAYWADGLRRYAQEPSSPIVTQIWDGQALLMEKSPTGTARYIAHEGEVFGEKRGDTRYLYLPDPLGSVVALVDNAQAITDSFIYLPYGEEQSRTGSTASYLRWLGRWGYRRDYTNRAYVRARVMRTDFGKRMTEDPLGFDAGDVNLYRYVAGNPMTWLDPSGMAAVVFQGCSPGQELTLRLAWDAMCSRQGPLDECACTECSGMKTDDCFASICAGTANDRGQPTIIICETASDGGCMNAAGSGSVTCSSGHGRTIHICPPAWSTRCDSLHCLLAHEVIHLCYHGPAQHGSACFGCIRKNFPSCRRVG